jgi:hypothetical protein
MNYVYICVSDTNDEIVGVFTSLEDAFASWALSFSKIADSVTMRSEGGKHVIYSMIDGRSNEIGSILRMPLYTAVEHL